MEEMIKFNARCYVLIRSKQNRILVMQERWQGVDLNKFPGGGLELGEGLLECIHREIAEEFLSSEKLAYSHFLPLPNTSPRDSSRKSNCC
jgi:ADP-ribose pyrophosphatase YjhB (NUDIX family)